MPSCDRMASRYRVPVVVEALLVTYLLRQRFLAEKCSTNTVEEEVELPVELRNSGHERS